MAKRKYCCCDLKTEAFVIALLCLIGTSLSSLSNIIYLTTEHEENKNKFNKTLLQVVVEEEVQHYNRKEAAGALAGSIIILIITALLVYGITKEKRFCILPWLIIQGIGGVLLALAMFIVLFFLPFYVTIVIAILMLPFCYAWHAIWSFYRSLNPNNPSYKPQAPVYAANQLGHPQPPGAVAYTPVVPAYNQSQPGYPQPPGVIAYTPGSTAYDQNQLGHPQPISAAPYTPGLPTYDGTANQPQKI